jgi:ribosomal protein S12 methylthiotransferase
LKSLKTIHVVSLGCPKNLVDTEKILAGHFSGLKPVSDPRDADVIFINTCSFILPAKEESIETILEFAQWKKQYPDKRIVVTGCLWEQHGEELAEEIPEVEFLSNKNVFLSLERNLTTSPYAYLKIAEGCSRKCSFCTIPLFKGNHKSRSMEDILEEARMMEGKVEELIVVSQDTSYYGTDLYQESRFPDLIRSLSDMNFPWIRILYFYPQNITPEIMDLMASRDNICNYLDLPLQHLSGPVLRSMKRWGSFEEYKAIIDAFRERIPDIAIRSSFIVGYPGETREDFEFLLDGLDELKLDRVGFFGYSDEAEAFSASLEGKVPEEVIEERLSRAVFVQEEISEEKLEKRIGKTEKILIEHFDSQENRYIGRSQYEAPEIDGIIYLEKEGEIQSPWVEAEIVGHDIHNLWAKEIKK